MSRASYFFKFPFCYISPHDRTASSGAIKDIRAIFTVRKAMKRFSWFRVVLPVDVLGSLPIQVLYIDPHTSLTSKLNPLLFILLPEHQVPVYKALKAPIYKTPVPATFETTIRMYSKIYSWTLFWIKYIYANQYIYFGFESVKLIRADLVHTMCYWTRFLDIFSGRCR